MFLYTLSFLVCFFGFHNQSYIGTLRTFYDPLEGMFLYICRVVVVGGRQTCIPVVMSRSARGKREGRLIIPDILDVQYTKIEFNLLILIHISIAPDT